MQKLILVFVEADVEFGPSLNYITACSNVKTSELLLEHTSYARDFTNFLFRHKFFYLVFFEGQVSLAVRLIEFGADFGEHFIAANACTTCHLHIIKYGLSDLLGHEYATVCTVQTIFFKIMGHI